VLTRIGTPDLFLTVLPEPYPEWEALADRACPRWRLHPDPAAVPPRGGTGSVHVVDRAFSVARAFRPDWKPEAFSDPFPLPQASFDFVQSIQANLRGQKLLVVHGETAAEKCWTATRFRQVIEAFIRDHHEYFVVEIARSKSIFGNSVPRSVLPLTGMPLSTCVAVAAIADLMLCVDSLFLHIADLWRVPVVGLFGPTEPAQWGCRFTPIYRSVRRESTAQIEVDAVYAAMEEVLEQLRDVKPARLPLRSGASERSFLWH
jgi:ADP-heptose:LPS heptosyltransferase